MQKAPLLSYANLNIKDIKPFENLKAETFKNH
jgi:hypothetical protein